MSHIKPRPITRPNRVVPTTTTVQDNINITLCNRDPTVSCDQVTEWKNGTRPCFCSNTPVTTHTPLDSRGYPKTEVMVNVLIAILVGIALCIIGTMVYFMVRNYFVRSRMRDNYRRNFQELNQANGAANQQQQPTANGEQHEHHNELETEPLIAQPPKMKFDDFRYCFDGPNEKSLCGAGRYGAVHRVENRTTNKKYAMKIFRPSDNSKYIVQMWQKEYEHLTQVSAPTLDQTCSLFSLV